MEALDEWKDEVDEYQLFDAHSEDLRKRLEELATDE